MSGSNAELQGKLRGLIAREHDAIREIAEVRQDLRLFLCQHVEWSENLVPIDLGDGRVAQVLCGDRVDDPTGWEIKDIDHLEQLREPAPVAKEEEETP